MKNQNQSTDTKKQGSQKKNWNSSKSDKSLNDKNFSSGRAGLDDDADRDMDLSDNEESEDMDSESKDEFIDTNVNSPSSGKTPSKGQTESTRNAGERTNNNRRQ